MAYGGEGFRVEPDFRQETGEPEYMPTAALVGRPARPALEGPPTLQTPATVPSAAELGVVFDNPAHGEPGRDRFAVHVLWELVLFLGLATIIFLAYAHDSSLLTLSSLRPVLVAVAWFGFLTLGAGLSLRAGAVNLAVGPIAVLASLMFADHLHAGFWTATGYALGAAAAVGALIGVAVAGLNVPAWAASLAGFLGATIWSSHVHAPALIGRDYDMDKYALWLVGVFVIFSVGGAAVGAIHPIRRAFGRFRPVSDPADPRGVAAAVTAGVTILLSSLLAGAAGVMATMQNGSGGDSGDGLTLSMLAIGAALLGGTSAFGRRGGFAGTLLAVCIVWFGLYYFTGVRHYHFEEIEVAAVALLIGVGVTRLVEAFGRPRRDPDLDESTAKWLGGSGRAVAPGWNAAGSVGATEPQIRPTWVDPGDDPWAGR
jgi:ribose/xylose/arabinose/galactoside ABC-type transport system permease subunit